MMHFNFCTSVSETKTEKRTQYLLPLIEAFTVPGALKNTKIITLVSVAKACNIKLQKPHITPDGLGKANVPFGVRKASPAMPRTAPRAINPTRMAAKAVRSPVEEEDFG